MHISVLTAVVGTALAYGLLRLLRGQVRHQQASPEVSSAAAPAGAPVVEPELEPEVTAPWVLERVDLERGEGFICARNGRDKNLRFVEARTRLTEQFGLFQVGKTNADAVGKAEVMLMLVADLEELATNPRIQEAHARGLPVVLMDDLLATAAGEPLHGYLAPQHAPAYRQARDAFHQHWQQTSLQLQPGMQYFLTHSNAGCSLLSEEGQQLADLIGPRLALKAEVPAEQRVDMVVVPSLRTSSRKYLQVIEREQPVLVVKAADLKGVSLGDSIPAWRWRGGDYFQYPLLERKADSHSDAAVG